MWVDILVILMASASLFFTWKYIYEIAVLFNDFKFQGHRKDELKGYALAK